MTDESIIDYQYCWLKNVSVQLSTITDRLISLGEHQRQILYVQVQLKNRAHHSP